MNKTIISAIIVLVSLFIIACEDDSSMDEKNFRGYQSFDAEGDDVRLPIDADRHLVVTRLYFPQDTADLNIREMSFIVTNGAFIDWDASLVLLDGRSLQHTYLDVRRARTVPGDYTSLVTVRWIDADWAPTMNIHTVSFDLMFRDNLMEGATDIHFEFWTKSVRFINSETEGQEYILGLRDITLGVRNASGVLRNIDQEQEDEPHIRVRTKAARLIIED